MQNLLITDLLRIDVNEYPDCDVRAIYPTDSKELKNDKKKFPFILNNKCICDGTYYYQGVGVVLRTLVFHFEITGNGKPFTWDGASIPRIFWFIIGGKGSPEFLVASLLHDYICKNRIVVQNDRYLSSVILRDVLIACGTPKWKANLMFFCVDNWQKTQGW